MYKKFCIDCCFAENCFTGLKKEKKKKDVNIGLADFCSGKRTVDSVLGSF